MHVAQASLCSKEPLIANSCVSYQLSIMRLALLTIDAEML